MGIRKGKAFPARPENVAWNRAGQIRCRAPIHFRGRDLRLIALKAAWSRIAGRTRRPQIAGKVVAIHSWTQTRLGSRQDFPHKGCPQRGIGVAGLAGAGTDQACGSVGGAGKHGYARGQPCLLTGSLADRSDWIARSDNLGEHGRRNIGNAYRRSPLA